MYGHIHLCIKELVLGKFGQEVWDKILENSKLDESTDFLVFQSYTDEKTFALVGAVCEVSGIPLNTVLEVFGEYFVQYCFRHGYDQLLKTLGKDFTSFIQNLDALHANLQRTYTKLRPPSFRENSKLDESTDFLVFQSYTDEKTFALVGAVCEVSGIPLNTVLEVFGEYFVQYCFRHGYDQLLKTLGKDFTSFIQNLDALHANLQRTYTKLRPPSFRCERKDENSVYLHYFTERTGLHPIVLGVVKVVAREIYNQTAEMEVISISKQQIEGGLDQEHVTFVVKLEDIGKNRKCVTDLNMFQTNGCNAGITTKHICNAFPYHIVFDEDLRIKQCGDMIPKLLKKSIEADTSMMTLFDIIHPPMKFKIENILTFINSVFYLSVKANSADNRLVLRGQMKWISDLQLIMYICSPRLSSLLELMQRNIYLSDIPLYDVTRELILLNQQRIAEIDIAKKLDETTAELKVTSKLLAEEKLKTDNLLFRMLPQKVADDLKNGRVVQAEKFKAVTILFSDIVTFTNIAAACTPMDIVKMLNDLYRRFDAKTSDHNVYKVETIGDAYMVVSGVPEVKKIHAQPVANFALDMLTEAMKVNSPATGKPLQIRVGFHSGPVVAGVVGEKMPRYCLFGDTVNTASRMESHGIPGRIHVSPSAYRDRGQIEVKGKGLQHTYFLLGLKGKTLAEPDDNVRTLPMLHKDVQIATSIKIDQNVQTFNEKGENSVDNDQPKQTMEKQKVSSSACLIL